MSLTYDTRDSAFLTRKGTRIDLSSYVLRRAAWRHRPDIWVDVDAAQYFHLPYDTILLLNGEIASVSNWSNDPTLSSRFSIALYLGGANNLRGFRFRDVGPKDSQGNRSVANTLARYTIEYTIPIIERVRLAIFYDVDYVNPGSWRFGR